MTISISITRLPALLLPRIGVVGAMRGALDDGWLQVHPAEKCEQCHGGGLL